MTREEAIRILDPDTTWEAISKFEYYAGLRGEEAVRKAVDDACVLAVATLRNLEERDRGCEYCNDSKSIYHRSSGIHDSMEEDVYISGNSLVVDIGCHSYGYASINFCPMCGRRLYLPKPTTSEANS